jgi:hypothetical protein
MIPVAILLRSCWLYYSVVPKLVIMPQVILPVIVQPINNLSRKYKSHKPTFVYVNQGASIRKKVGTFGFPCLFTEHYLCSRIRRRYTTSNHISDGRPRLFGILTNLVKHKDLVCCEKLPRAEFMSHIRSYFNVQEYVLCFRLASAFLHIYSYQTHLDWNSCPK